MTTVELSNAISMIDENILCDILEERYQRITTGTITRSPAIFVRRFSFTAAAVAACILAAVFALPHFKHQPSNLPTINPLPTTDSIPGAYIPAFSTPTLDDIYATEPFDKLFPQKILDNHVFYSSYQLEYDPITNPNKETTFLRVCFKPSAQESPDYDSLEITISNNSLDTLSFADVANPQSYDLAQYYQEKNDLPIKGNYFPTFLPADISQELLEYRVYIFDDGLCKASVQILFEDFVVSYGYTGSAITAADFYAMITSSQWFQ